MNSTSTQEQTTREQKLEAAHWHNQPEAKGIVESVGIDRIVVKWSDRLTVAECPKHLRAVPVEQPPASPQVVTDKLVTPKGRLPHLESRTNECGNIEWLIVAIDSDGSPYSWSPLDGWQIRRYAFPSKADAELRLAGAKRAWADSLPSQDKPVAPEQGGGDELSPIEKYDRWCKWMARQFGEAYAEEWEAIEAIPGATMPKLYGVMCEAIEAGQWAWLTPAPQSVTQEGKGNG